MNDRTTTLTLGVFIQRNFAADFCDAVQHYAYLLNVYVLRSHAFGDQITASKDPFK